MTEDFLHFVWQFGLFDRNNLKALTGEEIDIITIGQYNSDAGPDFFNARIRINGIEWAGNVELHLRSSDWNKHGHTNDSAYNNVILHVIEEYDINIFNKSGTKIPAIKLQFNKLLLENYLKLYGSVNSIACSRHLPNINADTLGLFLPSLAIERLEQKTIEIKEKLKASGNNWEDVFYKTLARNFGFRINSLPFAMLADAVPLLALAKQKNNLLQIEAMFFGQSGLLPKKAEHPYIKSLQAEYAFLKSKFNLNPLQKDIWKYLRVRPVNFPTVRIAQFAALIHQSTALFSKIMEQESMESVFILFSVTASEYWNTHYSFETPSPDEPKTLGKESLQTIIINTVVPFVFLYGQEKGKEDVSDRAVRFLESLPSENNKIIRLWLDAKAKSKNAMESQALIQLYNNYCLTHKCLNCQIGTSIIRSTKQLI
jgi:hypothetical protein